MGKAPGDARSRLFRLHRRVLDPSERGAGLTACRFLLSLPAAGYWLGMRVRTRLYDTGRSGAHRAPVPVLSVGNLTAGGTGKTPFVAWLAEFLRARGLRPTILSRGYGRDPASGLDDENQMLALLAPEVPIIVSANRARAVKERAWDAPGSVAVLDDGFQHRRLARDLDIVLVDALLPFGGGHVLPRGLLREPLSALARAGLIVITRADQVPPEQLQEIRARIAEHAPDAPVALAVHRPLGLQVVSADAQDASERKSLDELSEGRWAAFCGIGNPDAFRATLEALGAEVGPFVAFADHHRYGADELRALIETARAEGCRGLVTTEKDAIKVAPLLDGAPALPVLALQVRIEVTEGADLLEERITNALEFKAAPPRES